MCNDVVYYHVARVQCVCEECMFMYISTCTVIYKLQGLYGEGIPPRGALKKKWQQVGNNVKHQVLGLASGALFGRGACDME